MNGPPVTAIIIFFNAEAFLEEAITSVMDQTLDGFELLLCDDGSTDGSSDRARAWARRVPTVVRYLEHEGHANRGMSATRNLGIAAAAGDFIAFIDADDVWRPRKLEEQLEVMRQHPELGMVCGTVCYWYSWAGGDDVLTPTGHRWNEVVRPPEAALALYPLGSAAAPCPSDVLFRREALTSVGLFEEHFTGPRQMYEDQGLLTKLYLTWPVMFCDAVWLHYRQHEDSCVADVARQGLYDDVREYFLTWYDGYLDAHPQLASAEVRGSLRRALRPYRHPVGHALLARAGHLSRAPRRALRWASRRWAPATRADAFRGGGR